MYSNLNWLANISHFVLDSNTFLSSANLIFILAIRYVCFCVDYRFFTIHSQVSLWIWKKCQLRHIKNLIRFVLNNDIFKVEITNSFNLNWLGIWHAPFERRQNANCVNNIVADPAFLCISGSHFSVWNTVHLNPDPDTKQSSYACFYLIDMSLVVYCSWQWIFITSGGICRSFKKLIKVIQIALILIDSRLESISTNPYPQLFRITAEVGESR